MTLCECGCGQPTVISPGTVRKYGYVRGEPRRFLKGHTFRMIKPRPLTERFEAGYTRAAPDECWPWEKSLTGHGYGQVSVDGTMRLAHRVAYLLYHGDWPPEGLQIDHLCRNRRCVNPAHLEAVTAGENSRRGSRTRLCVDQVEEIRGADEPVAALAERFGVAQSTVRGIRNGHARRKTQEGS